MHKEKDHKDMDEINFDTEYSNEISEIPEEYTRRKENFDRDEENTEY